MSNCICCCRISTWSIWNTCISLNGVSVNSQRQQYLVNVLWKILFGSFYLLMSRSGIRKFLNHKKRKSINRNFPLKRFISHPRKKEENIFQHSQYNTQKVHKEIDESIEWKKLPSRTDWFRCKVCHQNNKKHTEFQPSTENCLMNENEISFLLNRKYTKKICESLFSGYIRMMERIFRQHHDWNDKSK